MCGYVWVQTKLICACTQVLPMAILHLPAECREVIFTFSNTYISYFLLSLLVPLSPCSFSVLFSGGNPEEAEKHADKAIAVDPYCGLGYQAKAAMELQK